MNTKAKFTTLAGGLAIALALAAPASAAPFGQQQQHGQPYGQQHGQQYSENNRHDNNRNARDNNYRDNDRNAFRFGYDSRKFRDRFHKPPVKFEQRMKRPHFAIRFVPGHWDWKRDHWVWIGGTWLVRR